MYIGEKPKSMQECFERIRSAAERLTGELACWPNEYCEFNPPATEQEIKELESSYGLKLPNEYKEFLRFSNGAKIGGYSCTVYGTKDFGVDDPMVPEPLYTVGELIGDGERIALDPRDGELYSCYNGTVETFSLELEMYRLVKECEENIIECEKKIAEEAKTPEQKQNDEEEYKAYIERLKAFIEERKKSK